MGGGVVIRGKAGEIYCICLWGISSPDTGLDVPSSYHGSFGTCQVHIIAPSRHASTTDRAGSPVQASGSGAQGFRPAATPFDMSGQFVRTRGPRSMADRVIPPG